MTLEDLIASVDDEEAQAQAALEKSLEPYRDNKDAENRYKKWAEELGAPLKQWLQLNPGKELVSDTGFKGYLREKSLPGQRYDVNAIIENNPALFAQLIAHGCLELNEKAIEAAGPNVGGVERYAYPKGKTTELRVERPK